MSLCLDKLSFSKYVICSNSQDRSGSTLVQEMVYWLMAPSHTWWNSISAHELVPKHVFGYHTFKITVISARSQWVLHSHNCLISHGHFPSAHNRDPLKSSYILSFVFSDQYFVHIAVKLYTILPVLNIMHQFIGTWKMKKWLPQPMLTNICDAIWLD